MHPQSSDKLKMELYFPKENESGKNKVVVMEEHDQVKMAPFLMAPPPEIRRATLNLDIAIEHELKHGRKLDPKMDRKKLRRTVSNRLSAQRSRVKKVEHVHEMEKRASDLEDTIAVLKIKVERFKEKKRLLQLQNEALERLMQIRLHEANLAQMVVDKSKAELERLKEKQLLHQQAQPQLQLQLNPFGNFDA